MTMNRYRTRKVKRFVNSKMILDFISKNIKFLESLDNTIFQIEKRDIGLGDEYYNESGYEYLIIFSDQTAYLVGNKYIYEEGDSYEVKHCIDYYDYSRVSELLVLEKLEKLLN